MEVFILVTGPYEENCLIVYPGSGDEVLVVDPGDDAEGIVEWLKARGWRPALYLLTHGHIDHVSGLAEVHREFPAPVAMHPADEVWAFTDLAALPPYYEKPESPGPAERKLADGQAWTDLGLRYEVMGTPGHSPGGVAFYFPEEKVVLSGDSLFAGSIGRSDLPLADPPQLSRSLDRLMELPDEVVVYPGHGPTTTIGGERRTNPYLRDRRWAGEG
ncbi:MAG TPA: MBL fold metallo-hydrolase [Kiritimatiellia bacterium]|nr:MBL fold metallo-hydrolase [Kiritimatiellia bacterium]